MPGLQSARARGCVVCGVPADLYCSRCGVAPYCSERCQRKDWGQRHSAVCHNLTRLTKVMPLTKSPVEPSVDVHQEIEKIPPAAPLRRPHSPKRNQIKRDDSTEKKSVQSRLNRDNPSPRHQNIPEAARNGHGHEDVPVKESPKPRMHPACDNRVSPQNFNMEQKPTPPKQAQNPKRDVTPATVVQEKKEVKVVPEKYMVELLPEGESFVISVEAVAKESKAGPGFVCTSIHENYVADYTALVAEFATACAPDTSFKPAIGETYAYLDQSDGGWYRARRISPNSAILLDSGRTVPVTPSDCACALPPKYAATPELCCVIDKAELEAQLQCIIKSKSANSIKVSVFKAGEDTLLGEAVITRWTPTVEWPSPALTTQKDKTPTATVTQTPAAQPKVTLEVPRPPIADGAKYLLLDVTSLKRACVRACADAEQFESVLQDVALHGATEAVNLSQPPKPGQLVLALFQEAHYRALVLKTKAAQDRYMIEYVEYGNQEVVSLKDLFECPEQFSLSSRPTSAAVVQLSTNEPVELTQAATEYVNTLKETEELVATIPDGSKTAPSGSLIQLTLVKNKESFNKKLEEMCTPDWKKLEQKGGDVIESETLLYKNFNHVKLPTDRKFILEVTDYSQLVYGSVSGYERGVPLRDVVLGPLTEKINAYARSELCAEPYLPKVDELCIVRIPPSRQWMRAVMLEHVGGAGSSLVQVYCVDYGLITTAHHHNVRKMMPEFAAELALSNICEIDGWPKSLTPSQLVRAETFLAVDEEGRGRLPVTVASIADDGTYTVHAPEIVAAITQ